MFEENGFSSLIILACALLALVGGPKLWQRLQLQSIDLRLHHQNHLVRVLLQCFERL